MSTSESENDTHGEKRSSTNSYGEPSASNNAAIQWFQPLQGFTSKLPVYKYKPCRPLVQMDFSLNEIDFFLKIFPRSLCIFIAQCTNMRIDLHNEKKDDSKPHTDAGKGIIMLEVMFAMCHNRLPNLSD